MKYPLLMTVAMISGCATSHYGREIPVIPAERTAYECPAIALEIAKCDAFSKEVYEGWSDTKGRRFLGFLMDFGIGDRRERSDALLSAQVRRVELEDLGKSKGCPAPPLAPVED